MRYSVTGNGQESYKLKVVDETTGPSVLCLVEEEEVP
jgi:hypothetical protein